MWTLLFSFSGIKQRWNNRQAQNGYKDMGAVSQLSSVGAEKQETLS